MKRSSIYLFHVLLVASDILTDTWSIEKVREPSMRLHDREKSFAEEKESLLAYLACDDYFPREGTEAGLPSGASASNRTVSFYGKDYEPDSEDVNGTHIEQQAIPEVYTAEQWQAMVQEASRYESHYRKLTPRGHDRGRVPAEMHDADEDAYYEGEGHVPGETSYYGYYEAPMHENYHERDHSNEAGVHYTCLKGRQVGLTFDDGPSEYTHKLLDILHKHSVRVTFFILGENIKDSSRRNCLRRMRDDGHIIASHSWSHRDLTQLSLAEVKDEMKKTSRLIYDITGLRVRFMRPPYGSINASVASYLSRALGYEVINWNLDTHDWEIYNTYPEEIFQAYRRALLKNRKSCIVLQHDTYRPTVAMQERIIPFILTETKYEIVAMDQCLQANPYRQ